jgi:hypothetical protein
MTKEALAPLTSRQITLIANNVVAACADITKLNKRSYDFLYLASGFIAHYNLHGFIDFYKDYSLKRDILRYQAQNQWGNFTPRDKDYDYYMSKKACYNQICELLNNS